AYPRSYQPGQDPVKMVLNGQIIPIQQRNAQIPKNVAAVIDRSLAPDLKNRYQTAGEMLKALAACR
ncbi:MAG TPA: serine/threonine protein kinase, partial [Ktedonobacteraceae bacterium]|nr:serine/threonine protein kinase [Ktedonobacteraceae bacterium]